MIFCMIKKTFELSTLYNVGAQISNFVRPRKFMTITLLRIITIKFIAITGSYITGCIIVSWANTHTARFFYIDNHIEPHKFALFNASFLCSNFGRNSHNSAADDPIYFK